MELILDENGHAAMEDSKLLFKKPDGEIVALTAADIEATRAEAATATAERDRLAADLYQARVFSSFANSAYRAERMIPAFDPETALAVFGHHFKVEGGQIIGHDRSGNKIFSKTRPGELAGFDEALEQIVESRPNGPALLRLGNSGGGASGGARPGGGDGAADRVAQIKDPAERLTAARAAGLTK